MTRMLSDSRRWMEHGTKLLDEAISGLTEPTFSDASGLPGWTRKHLVAHVIGNADALVNLVHWAATGEPRPMYSSPGKRDADIVAGTALSARELVGRFDSSARALTQAMDRIPAARWCAEVVTAQGRTVTASEIAWLRAREVMVHAVDLGTGLTFADLPDAFLLALCEDVAARRSSAGDGPALLARAADTGAEFEVEGRGSPVAVTGSTSQVTAYLTGRAAGNDLRCSGGAGIPELPPWL